ncbi:MAG: hypothetical protein R3C56_10215 [Pirellulaceae bacterium]
MSESEQELAKQRSGSSVQLVGHTAPVDTTEREDQENDNDADNPSVLSYFAAVAANQDHRSPSFNVLSAIRWSQQGDDLPGAGEVLPHTSQRFHQFKRHPLMVHQPPLTTVDSSLAFSRRRSGGSRDNAGDRSSNSDAAAVSWKPVVGHFAARYSRR